MSDFGPSEFADLLDDVRRGDAGAINALFRQLHPRLLRFLRASEPAHADDLAGEVWLAVAAHLPSFDGDYAEFRAWLFSIARRRIADHRRTGLRRRTAPASQEFLETVRARHADPADESVDAESGQRAAALIAEVLPPEQAEVILLRILGELDVDQVADITGKSANWVRVNQHRALKKLGERLGSRIDVIR
jgi:RNA polymerase sigma-70 factor (ECF subfamily)